MQSYGCIFTESGSLNLAPQHCSNSAEQGLGLMFFKPPLPGLAGQPWELSFLRNVGQLFEVLTGKEKHNIAYTRSILRQSYRYYIPVFRLGRRLTLGQLQEVMLRLAWGRRKLPGRQLQSQRRRTGRSRALRCESEPFCLGFPDL